MLNTNVYIIERKMKMSTQVPTCNVAQQYPNYDFKPSYNAVQLNLSQPTLNVPQPQMGPQPAADGQQKSWIA